MYLCLLSVSQACARTASAKQDPSPILRPIETYIDGKPACAKSFQSVASEDQSWPVVASCGQWRPVVAIQQQINLLQLPLVVPGAELMEICFD
jgi:hypothetical protein